MRTVNVLRAGLAAVAFSIAVSGGAQESLGYDPAADPFAQLQSAQNTATANGKRILLVAGGEWCTWCHYLDAFLGAHADIGKALKDTFVVVKIYLGADNDNAEFFATLPEAVGYPHFWVLAPDGAVLASQNTLPLEDGDKSYDERNFVAFIDSWRHVR